MPTQTTTILVMPQQPLSNSESFGSKRDFHSSASPRRKTRHLLCSRYETFCHSETARIDSDPKRRIHRADGMPSLHLRRNLLCVSKIHSFAVRYRGFVDVPKCSASTARASSISGCCVLRKYVFRFGCWRLAATLLAVNLLADALRGLTVEPQAAIGVPIVAAILLFLARSPLRRWCALA
jgi:hypothetical protein